MIHAQNIKNRIKNSPLFGRIFYYVGVFLIKFLQVFIHPSEKQILFLSYSGRQYSDTPREAFFLLKDDEAFKDFNLVWAFNRPKDFKKPELGKVVSSNSLLFFWHLLRSKYWISNSSIDRLIPFDHPRNVYIQFWHGIPMKTLGHDEVKLSPLVQNWYDHVSFDYLFTYGPYDTEKMLSLFPRTKQVVEKGELRKAILTRNKKVSVDRIKHQLGIFDKKPIMLYVPTWRGYESSQQSRLSVACLEKLSEKYTVIYRGHYYSSKTENDSIVVADNFSLNKLFLISDVLITDYSSVFFDFSVLNRPIYLFQPDITEYSTKRGLYLTAEKLGLPVAYSEIELMRMLNQIEDYPINNIKELNTKFNGHTEQETVEALKRIFYKEMKQGDTE